MDSDQLVIELFHSSIDVTMRTLDEQALKVGECGSLMVQCLLNEHKILCCGEGASGALAQIFCSHLLNRFNYERPGLPAFNLSADATTLTALTADNGFNDIFANQIRALGQSGDLLLVISNDDTSGTTLEAIKAAHDRDMLVICLSNQSANDFSAMLQTEDIELPIPTYSRTGADEANFQKVNNFPERKDNH